MLLLDNFGNTPLLEAIKSGHEKIASLIINKGGSLMINDGDNIMASSAERGNPNSEDYDFRTPLHVAALRGSYGLAKLLVKAGANVLSKDRYNLFNLIFLNSLLKRQETFARTQNRWFFTILECKELST